MISLTETREERHNEMRTQAKDPEGLGPPSSQIGSEEYPERPPCRTLRDETHTEKGEWGPWCVQFKELSHFRIF